jgi:HAD superfamily hydrolase (TIGR01509 family)
VGRGQFDGVLFDFDGVVADTMALHREAWRQFVAAAGRPADDAAIAAQDGRRAVDVVQALLGPLPEAEAEALAQQREALFHLMAQRQDLAPVRGLEAFLARVKASRLATALVTSGVRSNVEALLGRMGLDQAFEVIVTAGEVPQGKPAPDPYLLAAQRLGLAPERCLVVEDALPGVASGVAAACPVLALAEGPQAVAMWGAGARWVAPHFEALPSLLWWALAPAT